MVDYIFLRLFAKLDFEDSSDHFTTPTQKQIDATLYHLQTS